MPTLYIIGGPNGSGKSSHAITIHNQSNLVVVNPDEIILEYRKKGVQDAEALRQLIKLQVEQLFEQNTSFIFESNLHNYQSYGIVREAKKHRYRTELTFLAVDDIRILYLRVEERVRLGGHEVSKKEIQQRYKNGLELLPEHIKIFDRVELIDSTDKIIKSQFILDKRNSIFRVLKQPSLWCKKILEAY